MNHFKKYLPSKKFITLILAIIVFIMIFLSIRAIIIFFKNKNPANTTGQQTKLTIGTPESISQKDSNSNGIPDYEEYLWGLDPNKNGPENKEFILAKKKTLAQNGIITNTDDSQSISKADLLSRQFFATIISLQQTGDLNQESMNSVSDAFGSNVTPTPLEDIYFVSMLKVIDDSNTTNQDYYNALSDIIKKYTDADIGSELTFIVQGISNKDVQALYAAATVAQAYQSFGKDLMQIEVPRSLIPAHLSMANNYEKTGQSIISLTKVLSDPLLGMKALLNYKKYSDALALDLEKISLILQ